MKEHKTKIVNKNSNSYVFTAHLLLKAINVIRRLGCYEYAVESVLLAEHSAVVGGARNLVHLRVEGVLV